LGQDWSIDTWFVSRGPFAYHTDRFADAMCARLDNELRLRILEIKYKGHCNNLRLRGIDIYKAVLRDGIETYDEFEKWLEKNPSERLDPWMP
jgi:hypothetical protein